MSAAIDNLWKVTFPGRQVDPEALAGVLASLDSDSELDFRTQLLIRDSLTALRHLWGESRYNSWKSALPSARLVTNIPEADLGPAGFPSLDKRVIEPTRADLVHRILREIGAELKHPAKIGIGGSVALILSGALSRVTEVIDVVNELPAELRSMHELLDRIAESYNLRLSHFRSRYLPLGWESRMRSIGRFGMLDVFLVDSIDIFLSKLFSARRKDMDDLRVLSSELEKKDIIRRIGSSTTALRQEHDLAANAVRNWNVLYGEPLPS